jgi:hypothetical protein
MMLSREEKVDMAQKGIIKAIEHMIHRMDMHVIVYLSFTCNGIPHSSV